MLNQAPLTLVKRIINQNETTAFDPLSTSLQKPIKMSIKEHNLTLLNSREDWNDWINSIEDLAVGNDLHCFRASRFG